MSHSFPEKSGSLVTYSFWQDVTERTVRSLLQTALPIASAVAASGAGVDAKAVGLALAAVVVFTVLKNIAGIRAEGGGLALIDRAGSAAAATILAFLPQTGLASWADWTAVNWGAVGIAAVASALVALGNYYLAPPIVEQSQVDLAA